MKARTMKWFGLREKTKYGVYHVPVVEEGKKAPWTRIGAAFPHKDGKGFNVVVDVFPLTGRYVIRQIEERPKRR